MHSDDPNIRSATDPHSSPVRRTSPRRGPTISVSGFCSGVGKTSVVEALLRRLRDAAALKATTVDSGAEDCPIDRACGVCAALKSPYRVITEEHRLNVAGKDTGRYWAAGARPVVWVQAHAECLAEAIDAAMPHFGDRTVVLEGNTPVPLVDPDLVIMVDRAGPRRETKPSALPVIERAHVAVLNIPADCDDNQVDAARRRLASELPGVPVLELDVRGAATDTLDGWLRRHAGNVPLRSDSSMPC